MDEEVNSHVSEQLVKANPTYDFIGKPFVLSNGKHYIRAWHKVFEKTMFYCYEEDFFWLDKEDFMRR
jgi:hypothetical protein